MQTCDFFRGLAEELIEVLQSLDQSDWDSRTCYPNWRVRDIASHLLFTAVNRLSAERDHYSPPKPKVYPSDYESLSETIDSANTRWAEAFSSTSPPLIIDFLRAAEYQLADYFSTLDQHGRSQIGVGWAGEEHPERWFETAREFTERWHHQQQIRDAVAAPSIASPKYLRPVLSTLIRAVPYWYSSIVPSGRATVEIDITGPSGGIWTASYESSRWELYTGKAEDSPTAMVVLSQDTAWRFLTRSIKANDAISRIHFDGDETLSRKFLDVISVMIPRKLR